MSSARRPRGSLRSAAGTSRSSSSTRPGRCARPRVATRGFCASRTATSTGTRELAWRARTLWLELQEAPATRIWEPVGLAWFARRADGFEARSRGARAGSAIPYEWLAPEAARELFPSARRRRPCGRALRAGRRRAVRAARDAAAPRGRRAAGAAQRRRVRTGRQPARRRRRVGVRAVAPRPLPRLEVDLRIERRDVFFFGGDASLARARRASATTTAAFYGHGEIGGLGVKVAPDLPRARRSTRTRSTASRSRRESEARAYAARTASRASPARRSSARASASTTCRPTRTSSSTGIRSTTAGGSSAAAPGTASSTAPRSPSTSPTASRGSASASRSTHSGRARATRSHRQLRMLGPNWCLTPVRSAVSKPGPTGVRHRSELQSERREGTLSALLRRAPRGRAARRLPETPVQRPARHLGAAGQPELHPRAARRSHTDHDDRHPRDRRRQPRRQRLVALRRPLACLGALRDLARRLDRAARATSPTSPGTPATGR